MIEINKEQLYKIGLSVGKTLQQNAPKGTVQNAWGEFILQLPNSINKIASMIENVKDMKQQNRPTPTQQPPQQTYDINRKLPNTSEVVSSYGIDVQKLESVIRFEFNDLIVKVEKQKDVLQNMNAYDLVKGFIEPQKETIINEIIKRYKEI